MALVVCTWVRANGQIVVKNGAFAMQHVIITKSKSRASLPRAGVNFSTLSDTEFNNIIEKFRNSDGFVVLDTPDALPLGVRAKWFTGPMKHPTVLAAYNLMCTDLLERVKFIHDATKDIDLRVQEFNKLSSVVASKTDTSELMLCLPGHQMHIRLEPTVITMFER